MKKLVNELQIIAKFLNELDWFDTCPDNINEHYIMSKAEEQGLFENWVLTRGASKLVFIPKDENENFIVKTPISNKSCFELTENAFFYVDTLDDDDDENGLGNENFVSALNMEYCRREFDFYNKAKEQGVEEFFVPVTNKYTINGREFYVQDKVEEVENTNFLKNSELLDWDYLNDDMDEELKEYAQSEEQYTSFKKVINLINNDELCGKLFDLENVEIEVMAKFVEDYSLEELQKLNAFCDENGINDLRGGNIGIVNDKFVIFDYSGYGCL